MKKIIGYLIIALLLIVLLTVIATAMGFGTMLIIVGLSIITCALLFLGVWLICSD